MLRRFLWRGFRQPNDDTCTVTLFAVDAQAAAVDLGKAQRQGKTETGAVMGAREAVLDLAEGTVRAQLHTARQRLAAALDQTEETSP